MAESIFNYTRTIYCTRNALSYKPLKKVTGKIRYGFLLHNKEAIEVKEETCKDLVNQCKTKFGDDYQYIQSGSTFSPEWDTVKASGAICQHIYADSHDDYDDL